MLTEVTNQHYESGFMTQLLMFTSVIIILPHNQSKLTIHCHNLTTLTTVIC